MSVFPAVIVVLAVVTAWRRRAARLRQASGHADVVAPAAFRNPDGDHSSGRWVPGTVSFGDEVPVFRALPDVATTTVALDPARLKLDSLWTIGPREALSLSPGMRALRLRSSTGVVEVALQPVDAEALAKRFSA